MTGLEMARGQRCWRCPHNWQQSLNVTPAHPVLGTGRTCATYCAVAGNDPATWKARDAAFMAGAAANCPNGFWYGLVPVDVTAQAAVLAARANQQTIQQWTATLVAKLAPVATYQDIQAAAASLFLLGVLTTAQETAVIGNVAAARGIATT